MSKAISNVVFTRNRPLQLEAYLQSLYRHMPKEQIQTYILYKVDLFDEEYSGLFRRFPDAVVIREKDFTDDFMNLFERLNTKYVLFGTDDVVYYDSVDFTVIDGTFEAFPDDIFGFSLRLQPRTLLDDAEDVVAIESAGQRIYKINWQQAKSRNGRYPFELNSTVYRTSLVNRILEPVAREHPTLKKLLSPEMLPGRLAGRFFNMKNFRVSLDTFHDPNALAGHCYRWCKTHKRTFPSHLYFQKICASAVQINRVNVTVDNPVDGSADHTVDALNEKYKQGYKFDMETIEKNRPKETHVGQEYFRLVDPDALRNEGRDAVKEAQETRTQNL